MIGNTGGAIGMGGLNSATPIIQGYDAMNTAVTDNLSLQAVGGNVGIGTTSPDQGKVEVKGGTVCVDTNSDDNASSCIASESDARLKENIKPVTGALDTIGKLRGVTFDWKVSDTEVLKHYPLIARFAANPHSVGLIAQEVSPVFPYAIESETVGDKAVQYFQLDYTKFTPLLIEAVKELKAANDNVVSETAALQAAREGDARAIRELRAANENLASEVEDLKHAVNAMGRTKR
jgi:hypothetical protein